VILQCGVFLRFLAARRRADIKRKKLKTLGKSKSTESEEECEEEEADEGKHDNNIRIIIVPCAAWRLHMAWIPGGDKRPVFLL